MKWVMTACAALLIAVAPVGQGFGQSGETPEAARQRAEKRLESLYLLQLAEALRLSEEQTAKVATRVRRADDERRTWLQERRQVVERLHELLKGQAGPKMLEAKIARWEHVEAKLALWRTTLLQELRDVLSPEQQARFVVFDDGFSAGIRQLVQQIKALQSKPQVDR
ncbi:MAG: hypothetical protein ACE5JD_14550 [Candidatus Methylomirabilia bacterium]